MLEALLLDSGKSFLVRLFFTTIWAVVAFHLPSLQTLFMSDRAAVALRAHLKFMANLPANYALKYAFFLFN